MTARDLALVAAFCALIVALVPVKVPVGGAAPIVLQNLGIMLAGAVLGARRGFLAVLLFLVLALAGLPVLGSGARGPAILTGPTVGYALSYPLVALVIGWLVERAPRPVQAWQAVLAAVVGGLVVCHALGIPGMAWRSARLDLAGAAAFALTFLPGDLVKAVIAGVVAAAVHKAVPDLLPARHR
ncbi:biotin transporter BioY [Arsenicicoccus dermatophilus]|uniref:biotin transporter BioY n=1 Tax=Arsenicicoccus dermatophilus TaxID=1076331 RepID=UPI001F4CC548|nr:biotin transporter BioY [Arsenicicoccus dermatophilus]MCH8613811.1 biotin transporter BioY [Arsenicicoccus dermatophilus]